MSQSDRTRPRRASPARTPLFDALRRASRPEAAPEQPLTRRAVLGASAWLALTLGRSVQGRGDEPPARNATAPRIAIVGGGIAGLNCARVLKNAGFRARLFEASNRLGGRIVTARDLAGPGQTVELGGEFIDSGHDEMIRLARRFDLDLIDVKRRPSDGLARETYFFDGAHHTTAQAAEAFRPLAGRLRADQEKLGRLKERRENPEARALDRLSIAEYLDRLGATGWLRALIEVAYVAEYGLDCGSISAIGLLMLIDPEDARQSFALYGESDERFKIKGGNSQLIDGLGRLVADAIEYEHRLESIRGGTGAGPFRLDFAGPSGRAVAVEADFVVLAVPFSVLRRVELGVELPPLKARAIAELGYGTNTKLTLGVRHRAWRERGCLGAIYGDEPFQTGWDPTLDQAGDGGAFTLFLGGKAGLAATEGTAAAQVERLLPGVERAYPGVAAAHDGRVGRYSWPTDPNALGSYGCYRPGQWTTIAGAEGPPVGDLYFAGEHCSFGDSGFMNSGAVSGRDTARALIARLRRNPR